MSSVMFSWLAGKLILESAAEPNGISPLLLMVVWGRER